MDAAVDRVLVANRGEIAVRVIRGCRAYGVESVAVYSEADVDAPHVWMADRAVEIGPPSPRESYLDIERILAAATRSGACAIHPGYGFLSENAEFAAAVVEAGLTWVGPPPSAIRRMGDKTEARRTMAEAGVPITPGTTTPVRDLADARLEAQRIGYPLLLKAAGGGGGKGMRVVQTESQLESALAAATREAAGAFGNAAVYVEKYLTEARHVEIQVLADRYGAVVHLGERDCSLQRRHQKLVEEAPAPGLAAKVREEMGAVAVRAAEAVDYVGAGTVEFLLLPDGRFYFLEMNTRIQVEHPVTEMVTGLDLVALQLAIAAGHPLDLTQPDIRVRGHAIECRIVAEDPDTGFLPSIGRISGYREPGGPGVRFDSGVTEGTVVTTHYDPLLAKCVVWGRDRNQALQRMIAALEEVRIGGVTTNIAFQRALLRVPEVVEGRVDTRFLERRVDEIVARSKSTNDIDEMHVAALAAWSEARARTSAGTMTGGVSQRTPSRWRSERRWVWYR